MYSYQQFIAGLAFLAGNHIAVNLIGVPDLAPKANSDAKIMYKQANYVY